MTDKQSTLGAKATKTRAAILAAATACFSERGYERTTIRAVAQDAGIDPALVIRYFGTKERLFFAASSIDLDLPVLDDASLPTAGRLLARHAIGLWENKATGQPLRVLLAAAATDPAAAERIREVISSQSEPAIRRLRSDAETRAGMIATQILGFALCRFIIEVPVIRDMDTETAVEWLGTAIQSHLDYDVQPGVGQADVRPATDTL